jgi:hypothetical protein
VAEILLTIKLILNTLKYIQEREEDYDTFSILKCACLLALQLKNQDAVVLQVHPCIFSYS